MKHSPRSGFIPGVRSLITQENFFLPKFVSCEERVLFAVHKVTGEQGLGPRRENATCSSSFAVLGLPKTKGYEQPFR